MYNVYTQLHTLYNISGTALAGYKFKAVGRVISCQQISIIINETVATEIINKQVTI